MTAPPRGAVSRPVSDWGAKVGYIASWATHDQPLEPGYVQVSLAEPATTKTSELPRRVVVTAGPPCTTSAQLRAAARLYDAAADWLDHTPDPGHQLELLERT